MKEQNNEEGVLTDSEVLTMLMMSRLNGGVKQESYEDYMARADKYYDNIAKEGLSIATQTKYTIK